MWAWWLVITSIIVPTGALLDYVALPRERRSITKRLSRFSTVIRNARQTQVLQWSAAQFSAFLARVFARGGLSRLKRVLVTSTGLNVAWIAGFHLLNGQFVRLVVNPQHRNFFLLFVLFSVFLAAPIDYLSLQTTSILTARIANGGASLRYILLNVFVVVLLYDVLVICLTYAVSLASFSAFVFTHQSAELRFSWTFPFNSALSSLPDSAIVLLNMGFLSLWEVLSGRMKYAILGRPQDLAALMALTTWLPTFVFFAFTIFVGQAANLKPVGRFIRRVLIAERKAGSGTFKRAAAAVAALTAIITAILKALEGTH
jgi:hypothetical protein